MPTKWQTATSKPIAHRISELVRSSPLVRYAITRRDQSIYPYAPRNRLQRAGSQNTCAKKGSPTAYQRVSLPSSHLKLCENRIFLQGARRERATIPPLIASSRA